MVNEEFYLKTDIRTYIEVSIPVTSFTVFLYQVISCEKCKARTVLGSASHGYSRPELLSSLSSFFNYIPNKVYYMNYINKLWHGKR